MTYTANYNLKKPDVNDFIKIDDINGNFDVVDTKIKANYDELVSLKAFFNESGAAINSAKLGENLPEYYLNYNNLNNKPTIYGLSNATPAALGAASAGSTAACARGDHVHPLPSLATLGAQKSISYGTAAPSGGSNGDIYIQY